MRIRGYVELPIEHRACSKKDEEAAGVAAALTPTDKSNPSGQTKHRQFNLLGANVKNKSCYILLARSLLCL